MASILEYVPGKTAVHRMNPVTKLFFLAMCFILASVFPNLILLTILLVVILAWWGVARIPISRLKVIFALLATTIVIFLLVQGFFYWRGKTVLFTLFTFNVGGKNIGAYTLEGFLFGVTLSLRILCIVFSIPILTMTTPLSTFIVALAKLKVPYSFNFTLSTALRFAPLMSRTWGEILNAQKLRAYDFEHMNFFKKIRAYVPLVTPLTLAMLKRSDELDVAIESRAFGAPVKRTFVKEIKFQTVDYIAIVSLIILLILNIVLLPYTVLY
ncbi:hypothetical protein A3K70_03730 [Candidatus Bathyarchaeota archaeon RBG_16_48_13]|nr:MAG: hypothetical protein A3K70_03730 [Candidatus Bathyarchaeota archaeon RBG_16_48_13]